MFSRIMREWGHKCSRIPKLAFARTGFTLLEMIIALGIFAAVVVTAIGSVLALQSAQVKVANIQSIQDNLRFTLEGMTKEMRTGVNFRPQSPITGLPQAYRHLTFTRSDGQDIGYCLEGGLAKKIIGASTVCSTGSPVTDQSVSVEELVFYVIGQTLGPADGQPRISISLRARSTDPKLATTFQLQTTVSQRLRDQ